MHITAARNALKRKKQHEHSLEQTNGQIGMLEQQISSIESANINQETLVAMKNAGKAMQKIHGKMKMEDVDVTMYAFFRFLSMLPTACPFPLFALFRTQMGLTYPRREQLREQHELTQEIGNAITSMPITDPIDEDELEADLAALEQENLDEKMLKTGTIPQDSLQRLPAGVNGESKFALAPCRHTRARYITRVREEANYDAVKGKTRAPVEEEDDEEAELRKLQAEMAMS